MLYFHLQSYNTYWFHYIGGITLKEFLLVSGCLRFAYEGYEVNLFATIEFPDIVDENTTYYDVLSDKLVIEIFKLFHYYRDVTSYIPKKGPKRRKELIQDPIPQLKKEDGFYNILKDPTVKNTISNFFQKKPLAKAMKTTLRKAYNKYEEKEEAHRSMEEFNMDKEINEWNEFNNQNNPMSLNGEFSTATISFFHNMGPGYNKSSTVDKEHPRELGIFYNSQPKWNQREIVAKSRIMELGESVNQAAYQHPLTTVGMLVQPYSIKSVEHYLHGFVSQKNEENLIGVSLERLEQQVVTQAGEFVAPEMTPEVDNIAVKSCSMLTTDVGNLIGNPVAQIVTSQEVEAMFHGMFGISLEELIKHIGITNEQWEEGYSRIDDDKRAVLATRLLLFLVDREYLGFHEAKQVRRLHDRLRNGPFFDISQIFTPLATMPQVVFQTKLMLQVLGPLRLAVGEGLGWTCATVHSMMKRMYPTSWNEVKGWGAKFNWTVKAEKTVKTNWQVIGTTFRQGEILVLNEKELCPKYVRKGIQYISQLHQKSVEKVAKKGIYNLFQDFLNAQVFPYKTEIWSLKDLRNKEELENMSFEFEQQIECCYTYFQNQVDVDAWDVHPLFNLPIVSLNNVWLSPVSWTYFLNSFISSTSF